MLLNHGVIVTFGDAKCWQIVIRRGNEYVTIYGRVDRELWYRR